MAKAPTVEDVARAAGVSRQTVSNVLNAPEVVRVGTQERVRRAIAELGYHPHAAARQLRTRRSSTIGIHLDPYAGGISGVVLDRFVHALTEQAGGRGMRIQLYAASSAVEEIERMRELTDGGEIDAVVITGTFHGDSRTRWLAEQHIPFVSFGRPWGENDLTAPAHLWVDVDGAAGTSAATRHLLEHAGPELAFLGWPTGSGTGDDRERGWREAMADRGIHGVRLTCDENVARARLLVADFLAEHKDVDGIVCASDSLAVGAHLAAVASGQSMLPVVGFDNTPVVEALGLSSVEQLPEKVAAGVLELLMGNSGNAVAPRAAAAGDAHVLVVPEFIAR